MLYASISNKYCSCRRSFHRRYLFDCSKCITSYPLKQTFVRSSESINLFTPLVYVSHPLTVVKNWDNVFLKLGKYIWCTLHIVFNYSTHYSTEYSIMKWENILSKIIILFHVFSCISFFVQLFFLFRQLFNLITFFRIILYKKSIKKIAW